MENTLVANKIEITVNDRSHEVRPGKTILETLISLNIKIPHLCHDTRIDKSLGSCGMCVVEIVGEDRFVKSCETIVSEDMIIKSTSDAIESYRKLRLEQILSDHNADCVAPCQTTCPAHIDIQGYLRQVRNRNFSAAIRIIKDKNPFPLSCGRVCPHPCESECRRGLTDTPVGINHVKRFVSDFDIDSVEPYKPVMEKVTGKRIAVVGAGPSGLSTAYYSAIKGHEVTVFERQPEAGGMLRYGIPEYRLPKDVLDKEIDTIKSLGVKILTGKSLETHFRLEDLQRDFDAVYLGLGSWRANALRIEGEHSVGVWLGIHFLEAVTKKTQFNLGKRVMVIGGGNTAIDCARTALRMGAEKVILAYRRSRNEMPAESYEVEEAIEEGVEMVFLSMPTKVMANEYRIVKGVEFLKMELGEPDRSGRRKVTPVDNSEFTIEVDTVIGAIGQSTNTSYLWDDLPVKLNRWGDVEINGKTMESSIAKVFSGGDCVTGPATVIQAVAAGKQAAESMDMFINRGYASEQKEDYSCSRGFLEDLPRYEFEALTRIPRTVMNSIKMDKRQSGFDEVETGFSEDDAVREAERCLECGCSERKDCNLRNTSSDHGIVHKKPMKEMNYTGLILDHPFIIRDHSKCISCGRCINVCKDLEGPDVLHFYMKDSKLVVGTKTGAPLEETDCVSCGQCLTACPCGALDYKRESDKVFEALNDPDKVVVGFTAPAVRTVLAEKYNVKPEDISAFMAGLLKKMSFDYVYDFTFAADLTIVEETTEFIGRLTNEKKLPHFTSCCPGWVNFVERRYPDMIPHLSTCKSPQQMMGATVRNHFPDWNEKKLDKKDVFIVSIVPCLAKKYEAAREEFAVDGLRDVDAVLTTTEVLEMIDITKLDVDSVKPASFDEPYKNVSGAGILFGVSGGVAEASLRMAVEKVSGRQIAKLDFHEIRGLEGVKEAELDVDGKILRLAVISGLKNVDPIMQKIRKGTDCGYDLIEVMACPGGCIAGAGHPVPEDSRVITKRKEFLLDLDRKSDNRKSHENPDVKKLYSDFYGDANSHLAHKLLHTEYTDRGNNSDQENAHRESSAYAEKEISVCVDKHCFKKGSLQILETFQKRVEELKLDHVVKVRSQLCKGHCKDEGPFVSLDGKQLVIDEDTDLNELLKEIVK